MNDGKIAVERALVSAYDKTGLVELARGLFEAGVEIVSTGGSATEISEAGIPVTSVKDVTGFPEMLGGRVKTLHPKILAGLLANQRDANHLDTIAAHGIQPFQLLVCNLYPFQATVESGAPEDDCIEKIDIGGPTMLRAGAKNYGSVAVVTDPGLYGEVLEAVANGGFTLERRKAYAGAVFDHTAEYEDDIAGWWPAD